MFICRLLILFYFSSTCFFVEAQKSNLIFTSKANLAFKISINNIAQHIDFTEKLSVVNIKGEQNYMLLISFKNDTFIIKQPIYVVDENVTQFYEIESTKVVLKKMVIGKYSFEKWDKNLVVPFSGVPVLIKDTLKTEKDSLVNDSIVAVPFEDYYKMPDYEGKIGCPWPLKNEKIVELKIQLQKLNLDDRKIETVKNFQENTFDFCITMEQTKDLMTEFILDETKIELIKFLYPFVYDQDNILFLKPNFSYENSFDELKLVLGI
ncbi:MAG: hypothetical protein CVT95_03350 [Bacteroidetes bacterium HGW-Bacteroidetes-12]|nr:MAG: hypothetical protein CVT95_03350 [Bacteroidetes bacterium HGW-Bacteroidetes-12]